MFCNSKACAGPILALGFVLSWSMFAAAQVSSSGLGELDLWGAGFLSPAQTPLPEQAWVASDGADLLALTKSARVRALSPAEQVLMRALVLSPVAGPKGKKGDALLAERARLMFEIGEAAAAAQLLPSLDVAPAGMQPEELAIDLQLATGRADAACLNDGVGSATGEQSVFYAKLRAVCFVLFDRVEDAELALELAQGLAQERGTIDPWFAKAVYAATGGLKEKPEARFDSGLSLALSAKAGLEPSISTMANSRKDLAAAIARQDSFAPAMRVQAAGVAAEAGLLDGATHREIYKGLVSDLEFRARTPLEVALKTTMTAGNDDGAKARALRAALRTSRGNAGRFSAVSRLLIADIKALSPSTETERMALDFVYASLGAGAPDEAARWISALPDAEGDPFERIWIAGVAALAGAETVDMSEDTIAKAMIEAAKTTKQKEAAARLFTLWDAMDIALPAQARAMLASAAGQRASGGAVPPLVLVSIGAAAKAGAGAEVILQLIKLTKGDAYGLDPVDARALVGALGLLGQKEAARMLALEATGYWRGTL